VGRWCLVPWCRSAAGGGADLAHGHSEAVAVCLRDLQSCAQGVAANPEGEGECAEGEDEAGHEWVAVDVVSIEAGEGGGGVPLCHLSERLHHPG
jgi:hypothetical protein